MEEIFYKLDLKEYLENFNNHLAREKPLFLDGDSRINYEKIQELASFDIKICESIKNLDDSLAKISKFGILHISEIFEFVKIIKYFLYLKSIPFTQKFKTYLDKIIIPDAILEICNYFNEKGELKEEIDERFFHLKNSIKLKKEQINTELKRLIYSKSITPYLIDTNIHYIQDSECLLLRGGFNHCIKGNVLSRSSNGFFYVLPNSISKLKSEEAEIIDKQEELIYEYATKISGIFNKNLLFLKFINQSFDIVDGLIARAVMAKENDLEFVLSDGSSDIILKDFSHPALKNPKPISVEFDKKILLITGVNAGGKSMLLKSILSATLLCKYLLPMKINSNFSRIGNFKEFDLILEDPQSVKNDISTFAGRMLGFSKLFGKRNILVGVDEIELGTDFEEAASLYTILLKNLMQNDVKLVVTTHHKRLALLLAKEDSVELIAALYDEENSRPKYEFLKGIVGKSYAFETALRYGIPATFVKQARNLYGEDKENLDKMIQKSINLELELKQKIHNAEIKEQKLDEAKEHFLIMKEEFEAKTNEIIKNLENEYYKAINEAKQSIKFSDIKDRQRGINRANKLYNDIKIPKKEQKNEPLRVGDFAKFNNLKGEILSINKNSAELMCDGIKLKAPLASLKRISEDSIIKQKNIKISVDRPQNADVMIDLHGLRVEEALDRLDKFLNTALIAGFDEVVVKHGIGTGKLAAAVKEFLTGYPNVKDFYDAPPSEGGFGSKIVKF